MSVELRKNEQNECECVFLNIYFCPESLLNAQLSQSNNKFDHISIVRQVFMRCIPNLSAVHVSASTLPVSNAPVG